MSLNGHTFALSSISSLEKTFLILSELKQVLIRKYGQTYGVLNLERKDQIGGEKELSACRRAVLRSNTMSPNDPKHDDDKG
ncbi:hypothetical protein H5410_002922 [Solanum commersonii]|uniref:Uncharacterized protein n=1 Tax=Solanum commersonii TaxID=4109 RepID=A0A9J6B373_SOLCO|nr:hypothetical protein H5410_002922 [Solanum commersonii]